MGDHPRLVWPVVGSGIGMQSLLGILEHVKDLDGTFADIEKQRCAADDAETILLALRSKVYPGLPSDNNGPVITSEDVEARMLNTFGDATAAREVIEDIIREHEKATGIASTPLTGLSWIALLIQFLPVLLELLKKWLESRE